MDTQPNSKSNIIKLALGLAGISYIFLAFLSFKSSYLDPEQVLSSQIEADQQLATVVTKSLEGTKGRYAVVIKNLNTGTDYYLNEHQEFEAGSLYKLWVMVTTFQQIKDGSLQTDEQLSDDIGVLNSKFSIPAESAEQTEGLISLSVIQAVEQMITISHNYAALLLSDRVKLSSVREFLESAGLNESELGQPPKTTAFDIALFLEKLYKGELVDRESSDRMLTILKNQRLNHKLPKYLPEGTVMAHKTGEIDYFSHDAGIVFTPQGDYIIVVLSESDSPPGAEERIAEISKAVYDFFVNK